MKTLIVGASGQVGRRLMERIPDAVGTGHRNADGLEPLDLADASAVEALVDRLKPEVVLNPAGVTAVDWCEDHPDEALATNATGPGALARAARRVGAYLAHFSTDYVFDGTDGPYFEDEEPGPINVYSRTKLEGEKRVAGEAGRHSILRTSVIYSWEEGGKNYLMQILRAAKEGKEYRAFTDMINSPTYAENLADAVVEMAERRIEGLYHVAGSQRVSRYDFAMQACAAFRLPTNSILPVTMKEFSLRAPRAADTSLKIDKAQALLRTRLLWPQQALQDCLARSMK